MRILINKFERKKYLIIFEKHIYNIMIDDQKKKEVIDGQ